MSTSFPFPRRSPMRVTFAVGALVIGIFALVPAIGVLVLSFTDIRGLPYLPVHWIGIENYRSFFSAAHFDYNLNAIKNTLVYAIVSTVVQIALALGIAVLLNTKLKGRTFARAIVFMPTVLGVTVIGTASCSCVRPIFKSFLNSAAFCSNARRKTSIASTSLAMPNHVATFSAVG